jgi:hypothetical protein
MYEAILLITALVMIFLGIRLVMKFREMAAWKDEDTIVGGKGSSALPSELRELKIEEPSEGIIDRLDAPEAKSNSGDDLPSKQT